MKRLLIFCLFQILSQFLLFGETNVYRYALFISSSNGFNEAPLTNAKNKVQEIAWLFKEYCKVDDYQILEDPDIKKLQDAFDRTRQIISQRQAFKETQFFLFYYGHGLPNGLLLGNELFQKTELQSQLESIKAKLKLIILDACFSEMLGAPNYLDFNTQSEGTVFITSSRIFEPSLADSFSPVLKTALMGDADGFTPSVLASDFFYYEIYSKQAPWNQIFLKEMFNFIDKYTYLGASPETENKIYSIFASLGYDRIPESLGFKELHKNVLSKMSNSVDQNLIKQAYNYHEECSLNPMISKNELTRTLTILQETGFKQDNYITLSELFAYLRNRIANKQLKVQTPTINLSSLSKVEPVKLAYNNNKATVLINYPGTVNIVQMTGDEQSQNILSLSPQLDNGGSRMISLPPGKYVFITEMDGIKYRYDKFITNPNQNVLLDKTSWSAKIIYHEFPKRDKIYLSLNPNLAFNVPLSTAPSLNPGITGAIAVTINYDTPWGIIGPGFASAFSYSKSHDTVPFSCTYIDIPVYLFFSYISRFSNLYFINLEAGLGCNFQIVYYKDDYLKDDWGNRILFPASVGVGLNLTNNLSLVLKTRVNLAFLNLNDYYWTGVGGIEFKYKLIRKKK